MPVPIRFDRCAKFFASTHIVATFDAPRAALLRVSAAGAGVTALQLSTIARAQQTTELHIQTLNVDDKFPARAALVFGWQDGTSQRFALADIARNVPPTLSIQTEFLSVLKQPAFRRVLDIGGRARSGVLRSGLFPANEVVVFDIVADHGVDVVGDAHELSKHFAANSFDAIYSSFVFEHLIMPWKVALEINRVLRVGGIGLVMTHQTVGMHDIPWDYLRFSDTAWHGIFNVATGFEVIGTELSSPQYIVPMHYEDRHHEAEKTAGFECSSVVFRKTADSLVEWPLSAADLVSQPYPA